MQDMKVTFELLKNYIGELPFGLFLFDTAKKLISWNETIINLLEISDEDLKKNHLGFVDRQIHEMLDTEQMQEKEIGRAHV